MTQHPKNHLLLLHLSDIHFEEPRCMKPSTDEDYPVRKALMDDVESLLQEKKLGNVDAILISGDIANKGHEHEFKAAKKWLGELSVKCGCPANKIYPVPGNHDICRKTAKKTAVDGVRRVIRDDYRVKLREVFSEEADRRSLLSPLDEYNSFAATYGCAIVGEDPFWEHELPLGPGWMLKMRGMTSILFSGPDNDREKIDLHLGMLQYALTTDDGIIRLSMMHHPPDWLLDHDEINGALENHCQIQLVGHKHKHRRQALEGYVRLAAGAVNPARTKANGAWDPGFNLIRLEVVENEETPHLKVETHIRMWQQNPDQFIPKLTKKKKDVFTDFIELTHQPIFKDDLAAPDAIPSASPVEEETPVETTGLSQREIVMKFWGLSKSTRKAVVARCNLLSAEEDKLPEAERYSTAFKRARENDKLNELNLLIIEKS